MTGMGRKKTQMKMSQGSDAPQVAPPRRRSGLFKRANELTALCAVETALLISFGHPGAEPIITNLAPTGMPDSGSTLLSQADCEATLQVLNKEYHDLLEQLEAEKKWGEKLQKRKMMNQLLNGRRLWDTPVDELKTEELLTLKAILEDIHEKLQKHMAERSAKIPTPTEGSSAHPGN